MRTDTSSEAPSCQESLEALVRYLARCAAECDYKNASKPPAGKDISAC